MDEDFRQWVINHSKKTTAREMVEDTVMVNRLLNDILYGRSKSFNKDSRKNKDVPGGLRYLEELYLKEREEGRDDRTP